jgi:hypothetical protein
VGISKLFNQIRYQQQSQQIQASIKLGAGNIATYLGRDAITGLRQIQAADGGVIVGRYLSNSVPGGVMPISQSSTIGLTGYINQKPY